MTAHVERVLPLTESDWQALNRRIGEIEREREEMGAPASPPSTWHEDAWALAAQIGPKPDDEYQLWELQLLHRRHMKERERRRLGYERRHLGRLIPPPEIGPRDECNVYEATSLLRQKFIAERMAAIPQSSPRSRCPVEARPSSRCPAGRGAHLSVVHTLQPWRRPPTEKAKADII